MYLKELDEWQTLHQRICTKPFDDSFSAIAAEEEEREEITLAASLSHLEVRGRTTGEGENAAAVTNW